MSNEQPTEAEMIGVSMWKYRQHTDLTHSEFIDRIKALCERGLLSGADFDMVASCHCLAEQFIKAYDRTARLKGQTP